MADISGKERRTLPFPLKDPLSQHGITPNDGIPQEFNWQAVGDDEQVEITLKLSLNEYIALASAVDVGRDIAYGEDSQWIWWIWTRAFRLQPESGQCVEYPPSASFIQFEPMPYPFTGDIPGGYLQPSFFEFSEILPSLIPDFIEDWLIDASGWTGYEPTDVITAAWAFPFFANWFNNFAGGLPRFTVNVQGTGTVELHLLSVPIGSRAIIAVDVEPNIGDILNGIIAGNLFIVETERDLSSNPPETYPVNVIEIELPDMGEHFIHVTFMPTVDPDIIPIQFGGGLRKVVLCGVTPIGDTTMDCEDVLDCIETSENQRIALAGNALRNYAGGLDIAIDLDAPVNGHDVYIEGDWEYSSTGVIKWIGAEAITVHASVTAHMTCTIATQFELFIMDVDTGKILSRSREAGVTHTILNASGDIVMQPNARLAMVARVTNNFTVQVSVVPPRFAIHRIDQTGLTGAQGIQGNTGSTGTSGTVPPVLETVLINAMDDQTQQFLGDLTNQYNGNPNSINALIPTGNPDAMQEAALCQALAAWVNLYCETKIAKIRSSSFIQQAWDTLQSVIVDAFGGIDNVFGWHIADTVFGCYVDNSSALVALSDTQTREDVVCCLFDELRDISLVTGSLEGAITACLGTLTDAPHDLLCIIDSDFNSEHNLLFFYLYGRALEGNVATPCPCQSGYSYLDYDFSISNQGFTAVNGVTSYDAANGYWTASDADPGGVDFRPISVSKVLPAGTWRACGIGIVYDTYSDCGITGISVNAYLNNTGVGGGSVSPVPSNVTDRHQTWSFANNTTGVIADEIRVQVNPKTCGANPTVSRLKRVRVWFAFNSPSQGTPSNIAPQGLAPNGSLAMDWWQ